MPIALLASLGGPGSDIALTMEAAGWQVKLAKGDTEAWLGDPADVWILELAESSLSTEALLHELWDKRFSVPLLVVMQEQLITSYWHLLLQLHIDWPAPFQMLASPYTVQELLIRVAFLMKECRGQSEQLIHKYGKFTLDTGRYEVRYMDRLVPLTYCEFQLLQALIIARGRVISKQELLKAIHGTGEHYDESVVKVYINRLRNRLEQAGADRSCIRSIQGVGYRLEAN